MFKDKLLDLLERSGWTFIQAFAAALLVSGVLDSGTFDGDVWKVGVVAAIIAAIKAVIAQQFGTGTAATLPSSVEPVYPGDADLAWTVVSDEDIEAHVDYVKESDE